MKTSHLVAGVIAILAILLIVLLWRQGDMADEIALLRARLDALAQPPARAVAADTAPASFAPASPDFPSSPEPLPVSDEARIAELERVANGQADVIQELWDKLNGMEMGQRRASAPAWSALQAAGEPDSGAGDQRTAWAPATEDGGQEWLQADFDHPVEAASIVVRENCAPGAIIRISAVTDAGNEIPLWQGDAPKVGAPSNTPFPASGNVLTNRVKIYLDTGKVPGWNEIDAVQLVGRDGSHQWASGASASSSYGAGNGGMQLGGNADLLRLYQDTGIRSDWGISGSASGNASNYFIYSAQPSGNQDAAAADLGAAVIQMHAAEVDLQRIRVEHLTRQLGSGTANK